MQQSELEYMKHDLLELKLTARANRAEALAYILDMAVLEVEKLLLTISKKRA